MEHIDFTLNMLIKCGDLIVNKLRLWCHKRNISVGASSWVAPAVLTTALVGDTLDNVDIIDIYQYHRYLEDGQLDHKWGGVFVLF